MPEPKPISGARLPLLERLIDQNRFESREVQPMRILDVTGLRESVQRELSRLFNTRRPAPPRQPVESPGRTTISYGVKDFSSISSDSGTDLRSLAVDLQAAVAAFEPRLQRPIVHLERDMKTPGRALGTIEGQLAVGTVREPVSFVLSVDPEANVIAVDPLPPEAPAATTETTGKQS